MQIQISRQTKSSVDGKFRRFALNPGFPKSFGSADLGDLAEEAREREKVTFTASELPLLNPIKMS
ncbi:hypothetical protein KFK09_015822 [Dendrobium nobile]|uniref:Uncharacterized protein n=1 Tax=Dendrobium nobile TaxID=94219 RepID=A0A8T3B726_DENNO|nr:hypothetical protein KFK09_015822 [Dendrobium nobile]